MKPEFLDFASILTKIGQTSPLKLINLVLDRSLNGIIRLRRTSPDRCIDNLHRVGPENPWPRPITSIVYAKSHVWNSA